MMGVLNHGSRRRPVLRLPQSPGSHSKPRIRRSSYGPRLVAASAVTIWCMAFSPHQMLRIGSAPRPGLGGVGHQGQSGWVLPMPGTNAGSRESRIAHRAPGRPSLPSGLAVHRLQRPIQRYGPRSGRVRIRNPERPSMVLDEWDSLNSNTWRACLDFLNTGCRQDGTYSVVPGGYIDER